MADIENGRNVEDEGILFLEQIKVQVAEAMNEILGEYEKFFRPEHSCIGQSGHFFGENAAGENATSPFEGLIFVMGCSSSEINGGNIGKNSSEETGKAVFEAANEVCKKNGIFLAAQCCEHLNRALVVENECARKFGYEPVSVVPWLKGGGSFATAAYHAFKNPVVVENIKASFGMDIGGTLIGMHMKAVAVPVKTKIRLVGKANVTAAYSRPKLIGGERARYR